MKAYFVASIKGRDKYLPNYKRIIELLKKYSIGIIENTIKPSESAVYSLSDEDKIKYYKRVLEWISSSDILIAEASYPSIGVGYEISIAVDKGKPVIVLYEEGATAPHFIEGVQSDKLVIEKYSMNNLDEVLKGSIDYATEQQDTRFNFFISPKIGNYLNWVAKKKRLPRAVYLRRLIEEDMKNDKEYEKDDGIMDSKEKKGLTRV